MSCKFLRTLRPIKLQPLLRTVFIPRIKFFIKSRTSTSCDSSYLSPRKTFAKERFLNLNKIMKITQKVSNSSYDQKNTLLKH